MARKKAKHTHTRRNRPIVKNKVSLCTNDSWGEVETGLPFTEGTFWFGRPSPQPVDYKAIWRNRKTRVKAGDNLRVVLRDEGMTDEQILPLINAWYRDGRITPETYKRARDF